MAANVTIAAATEETRMTIIRIDDLLGCAALKELDAAHGEVKSMRVEDPNSVFMTRDLRG